MAEVYWIRLAEHTDMFSEGYIGITSKTTAERFKSHIKESKRRDRKRYRINNVVAKYLDVLEVDTLVICSDDYAIELEAKLRPTPKIGWNITAGGQNVKLVRDVKETLAHTEEAKDKMRVLQKKSWQDNRETKIASIIKRRKPLDWPVDSNGCRIRLWKSDRYTEMASTPQWGLADKFYEFYKSVETCDAISLLNEFSYSERKKTWFQKLLRYFDGGWNPLTDPLWLEDFKNKEVVNGP